MDKRTTIVLTSMALIALVVGDVDFRKPQVGSLEPLTALVLDGLGTLDQT